MHKNKYMRVGETTDEALVRACRDFLKGCSCSWDGMVPGTGDPRKCKECRKAFLRAVIGIGKRPEVARLSITFPSGTWRVADELKIGYDDGKKIRTRAKRKGGAR